MMKTVEVVLYLDKGCSVEDDEYMIHLLSASEPLDIWQHHGGDDISLITECIRNHIDEINLPEETIVVVQLQESGEWEDVHWHKYYVITGQRIATEDDLTSQRMAEGNEG
jgi:hypothetical protein